ncbi:MAG: TRAP transporter large permease [Desulfatiglandaceae bacterium]|jgi:C4-dicarboxylate transporter, DctM subunit
MNPIIVGIIGILFLFLLLAMRMQIAFAMALVGFLGFIVLSSFDSAVGLLGILPFDTTASYTLSVIPLFLLMGEFANHSGMGSELYEMLYKWIGFLPGGLAMATVGACACFAAITGSSLATAAMFGAIAFPEMKRLNYSDKLATGCIAAGGTLGILIPPSSVLILYGIITEQSIAKLFIAGVIPGLCLALLFILVIYVMTKAKPSLGAAGPKFSMMEKVVSLKATGSLLGLFVLVIGGLYTGWFTATEAAGVGAFGAFCVAILKRRLTMKNLLASLKDTAGSTAFIFAILIGAMIFQHFVTLTQIPNVLVSYIVGAGVSKYIVISAVIAAFMVLGCFMEGLSIMVLAVPVIYPVVIQLGFDPIWFGIIITITMEMSLITPPVGVNVFVLSGVVKEVPMYTIFRGILPFWVAMIACIALLTAFPKIVLFLPNSMM